MRWWVCFTCAFGNEPTTATAGALTAALIAEHVRERELPRDHARCGDTFEQSSAERAARALRFPYAKQVPQDVFLDYVAPYSVLDEHRGPEGEPCSEWWSLSSFATLEAQPEVERLQRPGTTGLDAVKYVASNLEGLLDLHFHSDDTPKFMSANDIVSNPSNPKHEASCTGMSILYVQALRLLGVPARVAGTEAWNGAPGAGNHDWVEAYACGHSCEWVFFDAMAPLEPACGNWFCDAQHLGPESGTKVFSAGGDGVGAGAGGEHADGSVAFYPVWRTVWFPLAWAPGKERVRGTDRTAAYASACGECPIKVAKAIDAPSFAATTTETTTHEPGVSVEVKVDVSTA